MGDNNMNDRKIDNKIDSKIDGIIDVPHRPDYMLTTVDNPYNPFTQWDEWYSWDADAGYHTPGLLARIVKTSDELSDADQHLAIQQAIDEIISENVFGVHRKITHDPDPLPNT
jgi:hypothetical protein